MQPKYVISGGCRLPFEKQPMSRFEGEGRLKFLVKDYKGIRIKKIYLSARINIYNKHYSIPLKKIPIMISSRI